MSSFDRLLFEQDVLSILSIFPTKTGYFYLTVCSKGIIFVPANSNWHTDSPNGWKQHDMSHQRSTDGDICHCLCHNKRLYMHMHALHEPFKFLKAHDVCLQTPAGPGQGYIVAAICKKKKTKNKKYTPTTHFIQTRKWEVGGSWMGGAEYGPGRRHRLPAELMFTIRLVWKERIETQQHLCIRNAVLTGARACIHIQHADIDAQSYLRPLSSDCL